MSILNPSFNYSHMQFPKYFFLLAVSCFLLSTQTLLAQEPVAFERAFPGVEFEFATEVVNAGDGSNRFFVVEQAGEIKVFDTDDANPVAETFLDIENIVRFSPGQEMGLLGLAFHPDYVNNRKFYIYQTGTNPSNGLIDIILAEYTTLANNPNSADVSSRKELIRTTKNQNNSNHNGGKIGFGPDGYLYMSIGDGGGGGDPQRNAQNLNNLFGAILRVDVDLDGNNTLSTNGQYEIPVDNPRVGLSGRDELYAWGIRNTWKFSWDSSTGIMWGADVGQQSFEEINLIENGGNYGWNRFEANNLFRSNVNLVTTPDIKPISRYGRGNGDVSITGGFVYRGASQNTSIQGKYIYGDFSTGRVWALNYDPSQGINSRETLFRANGINISSFGEDEKGELYFSGYGTNAEIYKIVGGVINNDDVTEVDGVGNWNELEDGVDGEVDAIVSVGNTVYVAGDFNRAGGEEVNKLALYTKGQGWSALGTGANGRVRALAVDENGVVYAGGEFTSIDGVPANGIARWDGSNWFPLGSGVDGQVAKLEVYNNELYVGGVFETAGGVIVRNIAKWNGAWEALEDVTTGSVGTNNEIRSIAFDSGGDLYVGGNFDEAGGKVANRIAVYNGTTWSTLGDGTSGFVLGIAITDDYVYAGGNFSIAGGETVNRIARWNKNNSGWEALGQGVTGNVNDLLYSDGFIYAGGAFEVAASTSGVNFLVKNVARWSQSTGWQALGTGRNVGTDNIINVISQNNGDGLLAGGSFGTSGQVNASNISEWELLRIGNETVFEGESLSLSLVPESIPSSVRNQGIASEGVHLLVEMQQAGGYIQIENINIPTSGYYCIEWSALTGVNFGEFRVTVQNGEGEWQTSDQVYDLYNENSQLRNRNFGPFYMNKEASVIRLVAVNSTEQSSGFVGSLDKLTFQFLGSSVSDTQLDACQECNAGTTSLVCNNSNIEPFISLGSSLDSVVIEGYTAYEVEVNAFDVDGEITNVSLSRDGELIRAEVFAPYEWGHQSNNANTSAELLGLVAGTYEMSFTATDNKNATSSVKYTLLVDDITSVNSFTNKNSLNVYPNPSKSGVYELNETYNYTVLDAKGSEVKKGLGSVLDLSTFPAGVYILKVGSGHVRLIK